MQAIGVIAFAFVCRMYEHIFGSALLTILRSQLLTNIRVAEEANDRQVFSRDSPFYLHLHGGMFDNGAGWILDLW